MISKSPVLRYSRYVLEIGHGILSLSNPYKPYFGHDFTSTHLDVQRRRDSTPMHPASVCAALARNISNARKIFHPKIQKKTVTVGHESLHEIDVALPSDFHILVTSDEDSRSMMLGISMRD